MRITTSLFGVALAAMAITPFHIANAQSSSAQIPMHERLVLHYTFDQAEPGARVTDRSVAGNHGRVSGASWTAAGHRGGAFQFAPPNQFIVVPNSPSLNPSNITLSAWIKTSRQDDIWRRIFDKSWTNGYALSVGGGFTPGNTCKGKAVAEIAMKVNKHKGIAFSDQPVTDGQWHHLVATYDGAAECFYVDGALQERVAKWEGGVPATSFDLTLGINLVDPNPKYGEVGSSFDGLIDDPMIFNCALSAGEVAALFRAQQ
jgi:hypothetical protein